MRVAVCISGALSTFPQCAPAIAEFFKGCDIFGFFWTPKEDSGPSSRDIEALLPFTAVAFGDLPDFSETAVAVAEKVEFSTQNVLPMYYGMKQVGELFDRHCKETGKTYDLTFRCRPDLWLQGSVGAFVDSINRGHRISFPDHSNYEGYCDQFAGGRPAVMRTLFNVYDGLLNYSGPNIKTNAEKFLKLWVDQNNIKVRFLPFDFKILRRSFLGMDYKDIPMHSRAFRDKHSEAAAHGKWESQIDIDHLTTLLTLASRLLTAFSGLKPFAGANIGFAEWIALATLKKEGVVSSKNLSRTLGVTRLRANQLLRALSKEELVMIRGASEDRRSAAELSPKGREYLEVMNSDVQEFLDKALKGRKGTLPSASTHLYLFFSMIDKMAQQSDSQETSYASTVARLHH